MLLLSAPFLRPRLSVFLLKLRADKAQKGRFAVPVVMRASQSTIAVDMTVAPRVRVPKKEKKEETPKFPQLHWEAGHGTLKVFVLDTLYPQIKGGAPGRVGKESPASLPLPALQTS